MKIRRVIDILEIKNSSNAFKKVKSLLSNIQFSAAVSWNASRKYFLLRVFFQVVTAVFPTVIVFVNKLIIDTLVEDSRAVSFLITLLVIYIVIKIFEVFTDKLMNVLTGIHQDLISNNINIRLMNQTNKLDLSYFDSSKFYDEALNAKIDSNALPVLAWTVVSMIGCLVQLFVASAVMIKFNVLFWVILLVLSIPSVIVERIFTERIYNWNRKRAPEERKMEYTMYISTDKSFAKDIRLYGIFDNMRERYMHLWDKWYTEKKNWSLKKAGYVIVFSLLPEIGVAIVTVYVCICIVEQKLTIGDFELYTSMAVQLVSSIWAMIGVITQIYENDLRISNYRKFLLRKPLVSDDGTLKPNMFPRIEFKNVSFKYPYTDRYILRNLSLVINPKERVALVGINGSGKTTLIKLLLRFYDATEGEILLDGINIKEYSIKELRKVFGVMFQDFTGYAFTARDNITISDLDNADNNANFQRATSISGVDKISEKWKNGYDTYLTKQFDENGEELSGGEWQKIALARAFFHEAGIVILDEPNAAMDPESEYKIFKQYEELLENCGAILISHRLSNVIMADRIFVLENGSIIENGTHKELLEANGRYAYLFNLQSEKYK